MQNYPPLMTFPILTQSMLRRAALLLLPAIGLALNGCAAHSYVTSAPPGAKITVNSRVKGTTPLLIKTRDELGLGSVYLFTAELSGYKTQTKVFKENFGADANETIPGGIHFVMEPAEFMTEQKVYGEAADSPWGKLRVLGYEFDTKTRIGSVMVDVAGKDSEARDWVIKNVGKIVSSHEIQKAGQETKAGGKYRILKESAMGGVLIVEFIADTGE